MRKHDRMAATMARAVLLSLQHYRKAVMQVGIKANEVTQKKSEETLRF